MIVPIASEFELMKSAISPKVSNAAGALFNKAVILASNIECVTGAFGSVDAFSSSTGPVKVAPDRLAFSARVPVKSAY
jgi:hypothetical protein